MKKVRTMVANAARKAAHLMEAVADYVQPNTAVEVIPPEDVRSRENGQADSRPIPDLSPNVLKFLENITVVAVFLVVAIKYPLITAIAFLLLCLWMALRTVAGMFLLTPERQTT